MDDRNYDNKFSELSMNLGNFLKISDVSGNFLKIAKFNFSGNVASEISGNVSVFPIPAP